MSLRFKLIKTYGVQTNDNLSNSIFSAVSSTAIHAFMQEYYLKANHKQSSKDGVLRNTADLMLTDLYF